jgi:LacI family transcriptional regulator
VNREPGTPRRPAGTAKQVAARAGVSVTTVSRVLNGRADAIPPETQRRVIRAATELGYRPNSLAVALRRGVTETVGLIVPDIGDAYFHQIARGVGDVAQPIGYGVLLTNTDRDPVREEAVVNMLLDKHVDGLIFAGGGVEGDTHLNDVAWGSTKVVMVGPHELDFPSVRVDDAAAVSSAVDHLVAIGRRRILCLTGQPSWLVSQERLAGYLRAIQAHGLEHDAALVMPGDFTRTSGQKRVQDALALGVRFDGVVAFNDYCAIGAVDALFDAGRRVPEDVAVVGCDDIPEAQLVRPTLSSISFSQYELGRAAAALLLDTADAHLALQTQPHTLSVRQSSSLSVQPREPPD